MTALACPDCRDRPGVDQYDGLCEFCWRPDDTGTAFEIRVATFEEFAAVDEPGADPLIGEADNILVPEGGDIMVYGDGGAGKTTLTVDAACHLGAGDDWLGMRIARPVRALLIENEGPRPLFRAKLRRKLAGWNGSPLHGRVKVLEAPWAQLTFARDQCRAELAAIVNDNEIDVLIAGPLTRLGMDTAGTLQEVRAFMDLVAEVRRQSGRRLTVILVHHENKGGAVSGAWEGSGDTLLHVEAAGNGHTVVHVQKARWSSETHGKTLKLEWADSEGFTLADDRNLVAEITTLLADGTWRTLDEIRKAVAAGTDAVEQIIKKDHADKFQMRTGDAARAVGRRGNAQLYQLEGTA